MNWLIKRAMPAILCLGTAVGLQGAISPSGYSNSFDSLFAATMWLNDSTLPGWYANRTVIVPNNGSLSPGGASQLYHFGTTGSDADRALGGNGSGGSGGTLFFGAAFQNDTGVTLTSMTISYWGEQWRQANGSGTLEFQYLIGNPAGNDISAGTWTSFTGLNFNSLHTGSALALDGNNATNRIFISGTINGLSIATNQNFWIRWRYLDDPNTQPLLGIDNFQLQVVPEPSTYALVGLGAAVAWGVIRARRRS
jgi:uncharacterized protein